MSKIIDTFMFSDESEIGHLRFAELYDSVDMFVVIESNQTHTGLSKSLNFETYGWVEKYKDKIKYYKINLTAKDPWGRAFEHRNKTYDCLIDLKISDNDIVLISAVDEIPNKLHFGMIESFDYVLFNQMFFMYFLDFYTNVNVTGTTAVKFGYLRDIHSKTNGNGPEYFVDNKDFLFRIEDGGWHYAYMGGPERLLSKSKSIAEGDPLLQKSDKMKSDIELAIKTMKVDHPFSRGVQLIDFNNMTMDCDFMTAISGKWESGSAICKPFADAVLMDEFRFMVYNKDVL